MPITLADFTDKELIEKGISPKLRENFVTIATPKDLKLTQCELQYIKDLYDWHERSAMSRTILGVPREYSHYRF